jgi:hypothetical protein
MPRLPILLALWLCTLALARPAHAYPQFQLSTGAARCNQCHYAPAGTGLINAYGRSESEDTLSGEGWNGGFLHGIVTPPAWLGLGGDLRGATVVNDVGNVETPEIAVFPMQADLYANVRLPVSLSVGITVGARGGVRPVDPEPLSYLVSREHWLMWRPKPAGSYARAGRFFAPFGLRLAEHPSYIKRRLGFHTLEETYNVSVGYVVNAWELHATAFTPDFLRHVGHDGQGGALYYERRIGDSATLGGQARASLGEHDSYFTGGATGKLYLEPWHVIFMGEVDMVRQTFADVEGADRHQLVAYLGATRFWGSGWSTTLALERFDEDLSVKDVAKDALDVNVQWLIRAHLELQLWARYEIIGNGDGGDPARVALFQVHYYL